MGLVELVIALNIIITGALIYDRSRLRSRVKSLGVENNLMQDAFLLPEKTYECGNHKWGLSSFSDERVGTFPLVSVVRVQSCTCENCGMIKRTVVKGFASLSPDKLKGVEGTFMNGVKCNDYGCKSNN